jgi:hypothetical protein
MAFSCGWPFRTMRWMEQGTRNRKVKRQNYRFIPDFAFMRRKKLNGPNFKNNSMIAMCFMLKAAQRACSYYTYIQTQNPG